MLNLQRVIVQEKSNRNASLSYALDCTTRPSFPAEKKSHLIHNHSAFSGSHLLL